MNAFDNYLNDLINKNKSIFSAYSKIKWVNPFLSSEQLMYRTKLINALDGALLFKDTKPYYNQISKGCKFCGLGLWSCLFINEKCNASCFYCPTLQNIDSVPSSQGLNFDSPESYAEYLSYFKFKGVSFSGGEPLLVADKIISYLKKIRKVCTPDVYIWMYTNGIFGNESIYKRLASLGLNEIRFNIGATNYNLDKIKYAKGVIENITIEIPAIPEEKERIKMLLPQMVRAGVSNLNLHQLRLTQHNAPKLLRKNYTYIPAERPIVLESELAALEIINYAKEKDINIGINYCSFFYKHRFQKSGFRKQIENCLANEDDIISSQGYIRKLDELEIMYNVMTINDKGISKGTRSLDLKYKAYMVDCLPVMKQIIKDKKRFQNIQTLIKKEPSQIPSDQDMFKIWQHEYIERGLRDY